MACPYAQGPPLNTDIAGIGVRVAFYVQSFLVAVSLRPESIHTSLVTNAAMAVTGLILGLKPHPAITFQDGLIMYNMTTLTGLLSVFVAGRNGLLHVFMAFQQGAVLAFALALWIKAKTFGSLPECNSHAVVAIFHPVSALKVGRIVCLVFSSIATAGYLVALLSVLFGCPQALDWELDDDDDEEMLSKWARNIFRLVFIAYWVALVATIELLVRWNHFVPPDGPRWQYGQVLPLFLIAISIRDVVVALSRGNRKKRERGTIIDMGYL